MEPAAGGAEISGDGVDERGGVVVQARLELGHSLRRGDDGPLADLTGRIYRHDACLRPAFEGGQLDLEQACQSALVRPDTSHGRTGVAGDH